MVATQNSLPRVAAFLCALNEQSFFKDESTQGSVLRYIDFYKKRAPQRRRAFRDGGFILLFLSISLPFLIQLAPKDLQAQVASTFEIRPVYGPLVKKRLDNQTHDAGGGMNGR